MTADSDLVETPSPDFMAFAGIFADGVHSLFGEGLYSLFLSGAGFFPHPPTWRLDVDYRAVLTEAPTDGEASAVRDLHRRLAREHALGGDLDGYYLLLDDARNRAAPQDQVWPENRDNSWALHRAHIHAGRIRPVHGVDPRRFCSTPAWPDLEAALDTELEFLIKERDWPQFGVLNLTRIIYSWAHRDVVISKFAAAHWGLEALDAEWHPLIDAALRFYEQRSSPDDGQLLAARFNDFVAHGEGLIQQARSRPGDEHPTRARTQGRRTRRPALIDRWASDDEYAPLLDERDARAIVADAVPSFRGEQWARPAVVREFDTWIVDAFWVVRIARRAPDAAKLESERLLLGAVTLPVDVPKIVYQARGIAIHRLVHGMPCESTPPKMVWPSIAADVGALLSALHATPMDVAKRAGLAPCQLVPEEHFAAELAQARLDLAEEQLPAAAAPFFDSASNFKRIVNGVVVCYDDLKGEHVLLSADGRRVTGLIDWADVQLCPPERDFARVVGWLGPRFARMVTDHYDGPVDLDSAIADARAWALLSLARVVTARADWPREPGQSATDRARSRADRRAYLRRAVRAVFDE